MIEAVLTTLVLVQFGIIMALIAYFLRRVDRLTAALLESRGERRVANKVDPKPAPPPKDKPSPYAIPRQVGLGMNIPVVVNGSGDDEGI